MEPAPPVPPTAATAVPGAPDPLVRSWWIPSVLGATVALILVSTTFSIPIKSDDIWWHLKTGEHIVTALEIPDQNLFSFTAPEHEWLAHEWLSEVLFYLIYRGLGPLALILFGIALNALACGLVYRLTMRYSRSPYLSALITLLAALMMLGNFSLRPYLFGNLFFVLALNAMEDPAAGGRFRPVIIFLLFGAWANFHGSFIIGLAMIGIYIAAAGAAHLRGPRRAWSDVRSFGLDFGVALVACIFTPHHVFGLVFPLTYLQNALSGKTTFLTNISEWQPAGFESPLGRMIAFYLMFCVFALLGSFTTPSPVHIGLLVAFGFFSFAAIRNIPLLGIAATPVLARHLPKALGHAWRLLTRRTPLYGIMDRAHARSVAIDRRARAWLLPTLWAACMGVAAVLPAGNPMSFRSLTGIGTLPDLSPGFYPEGLLAHLGARGGTHRTFNYFNWGGAFIHRLHPKEQVFIDQRNDCYPMEVFSDYFAVHNLERDWRRVLDRWQIDSVAYPPGQELAKALLQEPGWVVAYRDDRSMLFERRPTDGQPPSSEATCP